MSEQRPLNNEVDLRDYIEVILKRKKIISTIFLICVITTTVISFLMPQVYEATTIIEIGSILMPVSTLTPVSTSIPLISKDKTIQKLKTDKMLKPVIQTLNLNIDGCALENSIKIEDIKNTNFLKLRIQNLDPQLAVIISNTIADYFIQQVNKIYEEKFSLVKEEINKLEKRSKTIEEEIEKLSKVISSQVSSSDFLILQNALSNYETIFFKLSEKIYSLKQVLIDSTKFEVFKPATTAQKIKPNKKLNIATSMILGLMLGVFVAFSQEYWEKNK